MATAKTASGAKGASEEFFISRTFNAPRDLVWRAHTDCKHLKHWWGPKGFKVTQCKIDLRPGGVFHYCLKPPNGEPMWGKFVFREVVPQERLVYIVSFSDEKGGETRHPMSPSWPSKVLSTVTFKEKSDRTTIEVRWSPYEPTADERKTFEEGRESMRMGWTGTMDQLEAYLGEISG